MHVTYGTAGVGVLGKGDRRELVTHVTIVMKGSL